MKNSLFLIVFLTASLSLNAQVLFKLKGTVTSVDKRNIENATIYIAELNREIISNNSGYYETIIAAGEYTIYSDYVGYETFKKTIDVKQDFTLNITLKKQEEDVLDEVIIYADGKKVDVRKPEMSVNTLTAAEIKKLPVVLGETDILKSILLLPGVVNSGEGTSGFNVRGGGSDQNLLLLDQTNVFSSSHLYGFFSIFNNDAVRNIKLYKGGIPARYGGRASSVLEIDQKVGDYENFNAYGGIGLLSSRLTLEGPIIKDKFSYLVSGRGSYAHLFLKLTDIKSTAYFYDLNAKLSYKFDDYNNLNVTTYYGRDIFKFNKTFNNNFGNTIISTNYNHRLSEKTNGKLYLNYTDYQYNLSLAFVGFDWNSGIKNYDIKYHINQNINDKLDLKYGIQAQYYTFNPGTLKPSETDSQINYLKIPNKYAFEPSVFIEAEQELSSIFRINYGLRYSQFYRLGKETINIYENNQAVIYNPVTDAYEKATPIGQKEYGTNEKISFFDNLEPRIALSIQTKEEQSVKFSFSKMAQYIHVISNTNAATPLDIWEPSGPFIKPQIVYQYAVGFFQNFKENAYSLEVEAYYKDGKNRLDYIDGADLIANKAIEQVLLNGKTRAYGIEFLFKKNIGKFNGWIAYTISKSEQRTVGRNASEAGINHGDWYRTPYDRLHDLTIIGNYELNKKWSLSGNFTLQTGRPVTYPVAKYDFLGQTINDFDYRNNYSLPTFHHLDISATYVPNPESKKRWKSEWVFSIYNIYGRKNAASISFRENEDFRYKTEAVKLSIFGIVPSVTYNFKF